MKTVSASVVFIFMIMTAAIAQSPGSKRFRERGGRIKLEPRSQVDSLRKKYDAAVAASRAAYTNAKTDEERKAASGKAPQWQDSVPQFFRIAETYPNDPAAIDALIWIASHDMFGSDGEKALKILTEKHAGSPQVIDYAAKNFRYGGPFPPYEELLRTVFKKEHSRDVRAAIAVTLAIYLKMCKETYDETLLLNSLGKGAVGPRSTWKM